MLIIGELLAIEPPRELVYAWCVEPGAGDDERVTVRFEARGQQTEVVVVHERILDPAVRATHAAGWEGCLDGLVAHLE